MDQQHSSDISCIYIHNTSLEKTIAELFRDPEGNPNQTGLMSNERRKSSLLNSLCPQSSAPEAKPFPPRISYSRCSYKPSVFGSLESCLVLKNLSKLDLPDVRPGISHLRQAFEQSW